MQLDRRTFFTSLAALSGLGAFAVGPVLAQSRGGPVSFPVLEVPPQTHAVLRFDVVAAGAGYRLFLAVPRGTAPAGGWPSLWMLDGNAAFSRLSVAQLEACPGLAVVGIGYPTEAAFDGAARARDYTPVPLETPRHGRGRNWDFGGQKAFRARLLGPLAAALAARAPLDPARRSLWGHSYGGLFALATLFAAPDAFRAYVPVSPSTGFGGDALAALEAKARPAPAGKKPHVLMMLGDREQRSGTAAPAHPRPAPATMALAGRLRQRSDLLLDLDVLAGLGHGATFAASLPRAFALAAA